MNGADILTPVRSPLRRLTGVQIIGTGSYVPDKVVTNDALASLGCDADWIIQRTGIRERRHAPPEISTGDMAFAAAERCIQAADIDRRRSICCRRDAFARLSAAGHGVRAARPSEAQLRGDGCLGCLRRFHVRANDGMQYVSTGCSNAAL